MAKLEPTIGQTVDEVRLVRREEETAATSFEALDAIEAAVSKLLVPDHQHLVDEEEICRYMHGESEPEPSHHSRGVLAQRPEESCSQL
jgi:hypothetical protein